MAKESDVEALWIAECIKEEAGICDKMLLLVIRKDGTSCSHDTGLTADEAIKMCWDFIVWVGNCLRDADKITKKP
jgi:hypothetical protein